MESYFNAEHHKYELVELNRRYGNVLMPEVEVVDIKTAHRKKKMTGHFSERLIEEIRESLVEEEQVDPFPESTRIFSHSGV